MPEPAGEAFGGGECVDGGGLFGAGIVEPTFETRCGLVSDGTDRKRVVGGDAVGDDGDGGCCTGTGG